MWYGGAISFSTCANAEVKMKNTIIFWKKEVGIMVIVALM
jgi:hypothetical protein